MRARNGRYDNIFDMIEWLLRVRPGCERRVRRANHLMRWTHQALRNFSRMTLRHFHFAMLQQDNRAISRHSGGEL